MKYIIPEGGKRLKKKSFLQLIQEEEKNQNGKNLGFLKESTKLENSQPLTPSS